MAEVEQETELKKKNLSLRTSKDLESIAEVTEDDDLFDETSSLLACKNEVMSGYEDGPRSGSYQSTAISSIQNGAYSRRSRQSNSSSSGETPDCH